MGIFIFKSLAMTGYREVGLLLTPSWGFCAFPPSASVCFSVSSPTFQLV